MLKSLKKFIRNDNYLISIWDNYIDINNFTDIVILEDNRIVLLIPNGKIIIKGNDISIKKLFDKEILLTGEFRSIELGV